MADDMKPPAPSNTSRAGFSSVVRESVRNGDENVGSVSRSPADLERELEWQRSRIKQLQVECDGLRDWAEAAEAELAALKRTFWFRFLTRKHR